MLIYVTEESVVVRKNICFASMYYDDDDLQCDVALNGYHFTDISKLNDYITDYYPVSLPFLYNGIEKLEPHDLSCFNEVFCQPFFLLLAHGLQIPDRRRFLSFVMACGIAVLSFQGRQECNTASTQMALLICHVAILLWCYCSNLYRRRRGSAGDAPGDERDSVSAGPGYLSVRTARQIPPDPAAGRLWHPPGHLERLRGRGLPAV